MSYGIMCALHTIFFVVCSALQGTESARPPTRPPLQCSGRSRRVCLLFAAAFDAHHRLALYAITGVTCCLTGCPSPSLDTSIAVFTCLLGTLVGGLAAHAFETRNRERFLDEIVARDAMLVWRAAALSRGEGVMPDGY